MRIKTILFQNLFLIIGFYFIYKFNSLMNYEQYIMVENNGHLVNGGWIDIKFLGVHLFDILFTDIQDVAYIFLAFGIMFVMISAGMIVSKILKRIPLSQITGV